MRGWLKARSQQCEQEAERRQSREVAFRIYLRLLPLFSVVLIACGSIHQPTPPQQAGIAPSPSQSSSAPVTSHVPVSADSGVGPTGPLYPVTEVVDGDTIKITVNGKEETLRLIGPDTPETKDPRKPVQCFGREASNRARQLLEGRRVRIAEDLSQDTRDRYGRMLVYVWTEEGVFYNLQMIQDGFAHEYTYQVPYQYQQQFRAAEAEAREAGRGFWSPRTCGGDTKQPADEGSQTKSKPTPTPVPKQGVDAPSGNCDPNYEGACIPPYSQGDVDCGEIDARNIRIVGSDPHRLDGIPKDGVGCESE